MGPALVGSSDEDADADEVEVEVEVEQPASRSMRTPRIAVAVRVCMIGIDCLYGSGAASGAVVESMSGSTSASVRNMKKNTTHPIAEMKIQLTSR